MTPRSLLLKQKTKAKNRPRLPDIAEELVLNEHYSRTKNNQVFLIKDEVFEGNRMLIFAFNF